MKALPGVESVGTAFPSPNGKALLLPVTMRGDTENADTRVQPLLDASEVTEKAHEGIRIDQVGTGSTAKGLGETLGEDFKKAELISLPLTLLILLVVFGAIIAAGVPVLLAMSCVGAAIGLSTLASHVLPETSAVSNVILLMGMAVGVDYSLFYLKREREERHKGASHLDAIEIAAETSGHTVVVSGTTVIVSMAGLYLAQEATFASLATGSIIVVAVAVLASLTVLPALSPSSAAGSTGRGSRCCGGSRCAPASPGSGPCCCAPRSYGRRSPSWSPSAPCSPSPCRPST